MRVDEFDFDLPEELIALRPAVPRDASRMLVVNGRSRGSIEDDVFASLPDFFQAGDVLVFNDTRVIPAQLEGIRHRNGNEARFQATLHQREAGNVWRAFVKGAKKLIEGDRVTFGDGLAATVGNRSPGGDLSFHFEVSAAELDAVLARIGRIPLPPYIASKRSEDERDHKDYQTVYAREKGAVAAPTAGLHFTAEIFERLNNAGIEIAFVTLHVGAGTFLPVKVDDTDEHVMHSEWGIVSEETAQKLNITRANGGRIIAVGTTSLRLLESAAQSDNHVNAWSGKTDIFITPGYGFRAVDALITNFHLPRSTLFMLVSAFAGQQTMKTAYAHAIANQYRFYSYGDSSLLFPAAS